MIKFQKKSEEDWKKMLNHNGLHYGKMGLWDPRTDMQIFDYDKITKMSKELSIPNFDNWVILHENVHRVFYHSTSFMDIASLTHMINQEFAEGTQQIKSHGKFETTIDGSKLAFLKHNAFRVQRLLRDMDPLLDAYYAFVLCLTKEIQHVDNEDFLRILVSNLSKPSSKKLFFDLMWLSEKSSEICGDDSLLPDYALSYSIAFGLQPFLKHADQLESHFPSEIFQVLINALQQRYETSSKYTIELFRKIGQIVRKSSRNNWAKAYLELQSEIANYNPNFTIITKGSFDELRWYCHSDLTRLLGTTFPKMQKSKLMKQPPAILVIKYDDKISFVPRKRMKWQKALTYIKHAVLTHAQDCLFLGKKVECFLCKCDVEHEKDFHPRIERIEEVFMTN